MRYIKCYYLPILLSLLVCSCGEYKLEEEADGVIEDNPHTVQVVTRSDNNAPIHYPLTVYLFNEQGQCVGQEIIADESVAYSRKLSEGKYTIVLLSGVTEDEYFMPIDIAPGSYITLKESNFAQAPIQIAQTQVNLTKSTTVQMTLSYAVASVGFVINEVPAEATQVSVGISPVSSGIAFDGNYKEDKQSCTVPCVKEDGQWISETVYIFPNESTSTHLSVQIELPDGNKTYGYTYQAALRAGYPYQFTGNIKDGITLNGEFQAEGWRPVVDVEFGISEVIPDNPDGGGTDEEEPDGGIESDGTDTYFVSELPEAESIWEGFYVWRTENVSATECEALILSPDQLELPATQGREELINYEISGIEGWRVFTKEEAKDFIAQYVDSLDDLNELLLENGLAIFYCNEEEGDRYLCNNCLSSFAFWSSSISVVGSKRSYFLRPVKTVRLTVR